MGWMVHKEIKFAMLIIVVHVCVKCVAGSNYAGKSCVELRVWYVGQNTVLLRYTGNCMTYS